MSGDKNYQMTDGRGGNYSLTMNRVSNDDEGPYTVRATNHGGSISCTAQLTVQLPPKINLPKYDL